MKRMSVLEDTSTLPPSPAALDALLQLQQGFGVDPADVLADGDPEREDLGTRQGEEPPGTAEEPRLVLTATEKAALEFELCDLLDRYDEAMSERWKEEEEIRDNYAMIPDRRHGGTDAGSSHLASEATMMLTDQLAARLTNAIVHAKPLIRIDPVFGNSFLGDELASDEALRAQRFMNEYFDREVDLQHLIPPTILRTAKVGQAVWYFSWEEEQRVRFYYTRDHAAATREEREVGRVRIQLFDNRNIKVWPHDLHNWQRDYVFVGHETFFTKGDWLRLARKWKLSEDAINLVEADPGEETEAERREAKNAGVSLDAMKDQKLLSPQVRVAELWCHMVIPGRDKAEKFLVFLHRPTRQLLFHDYNPLHSQKHPYFPIQLKLGESSAWATGIGQEALWCQAVDCALRNLDLDNLMAGAYSVTKRVLGSGSNTRTDKLRPGDTLWLDNINDAESMKMGGEAPEIRAAKQENDFRLRLATKMAPVLSGQGDPTQKSGASASGTLALIEQANVAIRAYEHTIQTRLSDAFGFGLELVAQYAPDGLFFRYASEQDAQRLMLLKYVPPRGDISEMFRLRVEAPSAATSDEVRRESYMLLWTFAMQYVEKILVPWAVPLLQQENPAAIPRFQRMVLDFMQAITRRVVEHVEIPDVPEMMPDIPEPTPQDEVINQLNMQLAQAGQFIQQLQMQVQEMAGGGQMPPDEMSSAMPMMGGGMPQ